MPEAYHAVMKEQLDVLREVYEIQAIDPTTMTRRTVRYDPLHMEDNAVNRKHVVTVLTRAAEAHIGYLKLIQFDDQLKNASIFSKFDGDQKRLSS